MKNKKPIILITGSKGFIGKTLMDHLSFLGYEVKGIDRETDVRENLNFQGVDIVVHCAAEISRLYGEEQPKKMLDTNILGTLNVAKQCIEHGCKLINFSTSEVYGLSLLEGDNFGEEEINKVSLFKMTNIYGMSKYVAEGVVRHLCNTSGLKAVSVRPFMVYGAGQVPTKYRSALDQFIVSALNGGTLNVHKGSMRAWCNVEDFVKAIELIIRKHKFGKYEAYNIGTDEYYSMHDIAKKVVKMVGKGKIKVVTPPSILVVRKKVSFEKIRKLGFRPTVKISEGISNMIAWHKWYMEQQDYKRGGKPINN